MFKAKFRVDESQQGHEDKYDSGRLSSMKLPVCEDEFSSWSYIGHKFAWGASPICSSASPAFVLPSPAPTSTSSSSSSSFCWAATAAAAARPPRPVSLVGPTQTHGRRQFSQGSSFPFLAQESDVPLSAPKKNSILDSSSLALAQSYQIRVAAAVRSTLRASDFDDERKRRWAKRRAGAVCFPLLILQAALLLLVIFTGFQGCSHGVFGKAFMGAAGTGTGMSPSSRLRQRAARRAFEPQSNLEAISVSQEGGAGDVQTALASKLRYLLQAHLPLFEPAVEEELKAIEKEKEQDSADFFLPELDHASKDERLLQTRIQEVRRSERAQVVKELLYLKVCAQFKLMGVPLVPPLHGSTDIKFRSLDLKALTSSVYSKDALELVRDHLFRIVGQQASFTLSPGPNVVQIALLQVAQVYAMSALFGYYLRRVDDRFQLEKLMKISPNQDEGADDDNGDANREIKGDPSGFEMSLESASTLKEYIQNFGPEELVRLASVASLEAQMAMSHQVNWLFGDISVLRDKLTEALGMVQSQEEAVHRLEEAIRSREIESVRITTTDLRRLVLEAVAFGAWLSDSEQEVRSLYELTPSPQSAGGGGPSQLGSLDAAGPFLLE